MEEERGDPVCPRQGETLGDTGPQRQLEGWTGVLGPGHSTVLPVELLEQAAKQTCAERGS